MRRTLSIAIGAGAAAAAITMVAGVASAAPGAPHQATAPAVTATAVAKHVTKAQAVRIAEAKVPHSRAIEVQSDDLHDRAVWQVTLTTPHGRVVVDVGKRTGKATIVRHGGSGGGHGDAMFTTRIRTGAPTASAGTAAWTSRDMRDRDGDRGDRDHGDRDRHGDHRDRDGHGDHRDHREAERGDR